MLERAEGRRPFPTICSPLISADSLCEDCGSQWICAEEVPAARGQTQSYIFNVTGYTTVSVQKRVCSCGNQLCYDGFEDAVLNLDNVNLFSHEILRR